MYIQRTGNTSKSLEMYDWFECGDGRERERERRQEREGGKTIKKLEKLN